MSGAELVTYACLPCSLGRALVATTDRGVAAVLLGDVDEVLVADLARRLAHAMLRQGDAAFVRGLARVVDAVDGRGDGDALELDPRGTDFQLRVWAELRRIASGETIDYGELARRVGRPGAARAVASACARNPLAVLVPCHRVVRRGGALSGYRWGLDRKQRLLARERVTTA